MRSSICAVNSFAAAPSTVVGIESAIEDGKKAPVVVVGYGSRKIGLIVDYLEGKQEIVIKSLEQNYTTVEGLAGRRSSVMAASASFWISRP